MPAPSSTPDVTTLLQAWSRGDRAALDRLLPIVYQELHRQAARYMRSQPDGHTLQTTGLVHEAYLRLVNRRDAEWSGRAHFFGVAAKAMRSILVDHARARAAAKRGGGIDCVTLADSGGSDGDQEPQVGNEIGVLALDEAIQRLTDLDPRKGSLVELRYFGGLSIEETAKVLGISPATVKREWRTARAWLRRELAPDATR